MATSNTFKNQIQNRNFLSPLGFKFTLNRAPKTAFFSNEATIPSITLGVVMQPNYDNDIPVTVDKMDFEDFTLKFMVDEDLTNYLEIQNWMRGLGYPESLEQIYDLQSDNEKFEQPSKSQMNLYSDGTLLVLNSNQNLNFQIVFRSMFPYKLSTLQFDATIPEIEYLSAEVSFKYMMYNIVDKNGQYLPKRYS
jgi:hypothetical protein